MEFSEQQLVDCDHVDEDAGCGGGLMDSAFKYLMSSTGVCSEETYGYTGKKKTNMRRVQSKTSLCRHRCKWIVLPIVHQRCLQLKALRQRLGPWCPRSWIRRGQWREVLEGQKFVGVIIW